MLLLLPVRQVLDTLARKGECPVYWRDYKKRFRSLTRTELEPALFGYSSVEGML